MPSQVSSPLQMFPSEHAVPEGLGVCVTAPVVELHASTVHGLPSSTGVAAPDWQAPDWQTSPVEQALPSLQEVPLAASGLEHAPVAVSQVPATWHWSDAVQVTGLEPVHVPDWHVSLWVQALPSVHVVPFAAMGFEHAPVAVSQVPATWHWSEAVQVTGLEPAHVPDWHVSVWVHALPSLQVVPLAEIGFEHVPVVTSQVPAMWHWSEAVQVTGFEPVHVPDWHVSVWVQELPSLQEVPLAAIGFEHAPVAESQVPATWHWSDAVQVTGLAPVHVPDWHVSDCVQALPSLQVAPFAATGFEHAPVAVSQVPATWHWSDAVHVTGFEPVHVPDWQLSVCVQAFPSLHVVPFAATGFEHAPVAVSQVPATWHWSEAVQVTGFEPVHVPDWHVSVWVQALPSLQEVPLAAIGFEHAPVTVSQVPATWHWSEAVQLMGFEPVQVPDWHVSVRVQALPSLQVLPLTASGFEHVPVAASQVPATWHWSEAVQVTAFEPVQVPNWQVSVWVQALPSLHVVPFAAAGFEHAPVKESHVPATWH
jgi:hypothetical protein